MIFTQLFDLPPVNRKEILRYAGAKAETPEVASLLEDTLAEVMPVLAGKVCWQEFPLIRESNTLDLGFAKTESASLQRNLRGCDRIILFAATVGLGLDRLIARYGRTSPARALMLQAIGAERIEGLCDIFCDHIRREKEASGLYPVPRFSPGYGDFPLSLQTHIFQVLDCPRKIGLTLNESLLMSPSKSVTAIIGFGPCPALEHPTGCKSCSKADCVYRRTP